MGAQARGGRRIQFIRGGSFESKDDFSQTGGGWRWRSGGASLEASVGHCTRHGGSVLLARGSPRAEKPGGAPRAANARGARVWARAAAREGAAVARGVTLAAVRGARTRLVD